MKSLRLSSYRTFSLFVWVLALTLLSQPIAPLAVTHGAGRAKASEKLATTSAPDAATKARVEENYGKLPLSFEANKGQTDARVKFLSRGQGYSFFLTPSEAVMTLNRAEGKEPHAGTKKGTSATLRMKLVGANEQPRISGLDEQAGKSNYFLGNDARQWKTDVPNYGKVKYESVYPGVDVVYYGNQQQLEYDFIVAPGADPKQIKLSFADAQRVRLDKNGDLVLKTQAGEVRQHKPFAYQEINNVKAEVMSRYVLRGKREVEIAIDKYDSDKPLVIDPVLSYSALVYGGGNGIAIDSEGNAYVTGEANATLPTTPGALRLVGTAINATAVSVIKLNSSGTQIIYSALIGGVQGKVLTPGGSPEVYNRGNGIAVDSAGNAYVTGIMASYDYPTTPGAFAINNGTAYRTGGFVFKLNPAGSDLVYSTLLGGRSVINQPGGLTDEMITEPQGIAVDAAGIAYVTGTTGDALPTTPGAFQPRRIVDTNYPNTALDAFVTKINPMGSGLIYSTFLGGGANDFGKGIAVDADGNAYVTGATYHDHRGNDQLTIPFPLTREPFQPVDARYGIFGTYVVKFNAVGQRVYAVIIGEETAIEWRTSIAVDKQGSVYVSGTTMSTAFPTTPGAYKRTGGGSANPDLFIAKLNAAGDALVYSTYLGASKTDRNWGLAVDGNGQACVTGTTNSSDFPTTPGMEYTSGNGFRTFVTKLNAAGGALVYSGAFGPAQAGGIAADAAGNVYATGVAGSGSFPLTPGAYKSPVANSEGGGGYILKISDVAALPVISVSAASFAGGSLSGESIVAAFGSKLATGIQVATSNPLPTTLAGTTVMVKDASGNDRPAPLFFVSPTQINFLVPSGTGSGTATITITSGDSSISSASARIENVAPGLFTADASGRGVGAAVVLRVKADGSQSYEPVAQFDPAQSKVVPVPIDLGPEGDQVFLIAYGTGIRYRSSLSGVSLKLGGTDAPVLFAGAQGDFFGLDQVNVRLPRSLAGRGVVDLVLTADGKSANTVQVRIK
ncbi:MAG: SBBP repeat-containing protein [Acidobacteriota bacterium]